MADQMEEWADSDEEEPLDGVELDVLESSRLGHMSFSVDGTFIFWGGYDIVGSHIPLYYSFQPLGVYDGRFTFNESMERFPCKFDETVAESLCLVGGCAIFSPADHAAYMIGGFRGVNVLGSDLGRHRDVSDLYRFDLLSRTWSKLAPKGVEPLKSNKAVGWAHENKIYVFGGFGEKPDARQIENDCKFIRGDAEEHGWSNQLVCYDISTNQWTWPRCKRTPSPRAAAACVISGSRVFVFGGRLPTGRVNDLYMLDLTTFVWTLCSSTGPEGRSWHTFNLCDKNTAVLFGGLSNSGHNLSDCWLLNLTSFVWIKLDRPGLQPRMWHRSFYYDGMLFLHGGSASSILGEQDVIMANLIERVTISPRSLFLLAVNHVVENYSMFERELSSVPVCIREIVEEGYHHRMGL